MLADDGAEAASSRRHRRRRPPRRPSRRRHRRSRRRSSQPERQRLATAVADPEPDDGEAAEPPPVAAVKPAVKKVDMPEPEPVDLLATAGNPVAKRAAPIARRHRRPLAAARVPASPQAPPRLTVDRLATAATTTGPPSRRCSAGQPLGRLRGRGPPRRRLAAGDPQRPAARRRHARCRPATGWSASPSGRWSAGSRAPAASTGPRPRSTPAELAAAHARYAAERDAAAPRRPHGAAPVRRRGRHPHRA